MAFGDSIPLPKDWPEHVRGGLVHAVGLAHKALVYVQGWAADSSFARVRLKAEKERLQNEVALVRRELDLVKSRIERMPANKRPHYLPTERLAILELKAARRWNAAEAARRMLVSPATIASWLDRLKRDGEDGLVRTREPVNRFPQMVEQVVQSLEATLPSMGKKRISDTLARAGLHLSVSTVARLLKRSPKKKPPRRPEPTSRKTTGEGKSSVGDEKRTVKGAYPHHVWNLDFTTIATAAGWWVPWWPFSAPTIWPFSWHLLLILDQFSRKVVGFKVFKKEATAEELCEVLTETAKRCGRAPKYIVSDQGSQFQDAYKEWCANNGVKPRFGAIGAHGSIAVTERCVKSLKAECVRRIMVPLGIEEMTREIAEYVSWYAEHRPHQGLGGKTPNEVFEGRVAARDGPRWETRKRFPLESVRRQGDAGKVVKLRARRGVRIELVTGVVEQRAHLPVVGLRRAA